MNWYYLSQVPSKVATCNVTALQLLVDFGVIWGKFGCSAFLIKRKWKCDPVKEGRSWRWSYLNYHPKSAVPFDLFWPLWIDQMKIWQRVGVTRSKGTQAWSQTRIRCSEDKASTNWTKQHPVLFDFNGHPSWVGRVCHIQYSYNWTCTTLKGGNMSLLYSRPVSAAQSG